MRLNLNMAAGVNVEEREETGRPNSCYHILVTNKTSVVTKTKTAGRKTMSMDTNKRVP